MEGRSFPFICGEYWSHSPNKKEKCYATANMGENFKKNYRKIVLCGSKVDF